MAKHVNTKNIKNNDEFTNCEVQDIAEFLDCPIFWLMKIIPDALRNAGLNCEVQDVKSDLANHLANPGCLSRGGHSVDGFSAQSCYIDFQIMHDKYKIGDYSDFESQARQIITKDEEYHAYFSILDDCIEQLRAQMIHQAGFNPKLFELDCTEKRNYLNEKNKPKCELCTTPTSEFGRFCVDYPEMRHTYQLIVAEITRMSEENKHNKCHEYKHLLHAINHVRLWYKKPTSSLSKRREY